MLIPFYLGGKTYQIEVDHWAEFPRGKDGLCAFCHGDPVAEEEIKRSPTPIQELMMEHWRSYEACPVCDGRQS